MKVAVSLLAAAVCAFAGVLNARAGNEIAALVLALATCVQLAVAVSVGLSKR